MDASGMRRDTLIAAGNRPGVRVAPFLRMHVITAIVLAALALGLTAPRWWVLFTEPAAGVRVAMSPYGASRIGYDESLYTSSIRQVQDGAFPVSSPYLSGHQHGPAQASAIWHSVIGFTARGTGDVFSALAIITTLAAIAAIAFLYVMLLQITGSRWAALALIPIIMMTVHVFNQAENVFALRRWYILKPIITVDPQLEWHAWLRYPAPIMVLAPFFAAVIALPRAVNSGDRRWIAVAAGALALLVYSYLFYWTAIAVACAMWGGWMIVERDWTSLRRLAITTTLAAAIAVPEFVVLARSALELPADTRDRLGLDPLGVDAATLRELAQRVLIGAPFAAILLRRGGQRERFFVALLAAPLALAPTTGIVPQPWHYMTQVWGVFAIPAIVAGGAMFVRMTPPSYARAGSIALAALAIMATLYFAAFQARAIRSTDASFAMSADEHAAFAWIDDNVTTAQTVVSPSITTNLYLASLTPADEYIGEGGFTKTNDEELIDRMLRVQAAFGYSEDDAFSRLDVTDATGGFPVNDNTGTPAELERDLERFLAFYTFSFEIADQSTFDQRVETWRPRYRELLAGRNILAAHDADYLYCGRRERYYRDEHVPPGTTVTVAFRQGETTVYRLVDANTPGAQAFTGC